MHGNDGIIIMKEFRSFNVTVMIHLLLALGFPNKMLSFKALLIKSGYPTKLNIN